MIALVLVASLLLSAPDAETSYTLARGWDAADTTLELSFVAAVAVDWQQTRWVLAHRGHEENPLIGHHPSKARFNALVLTSVVGHAAVSAILPPGWRRWWQGVTLVCELSAVGYNANQIGVLVKF
jgi:hypothetical protein